MTNKQTAEAFANGKTTGGSLHMFIDGDTIFSYGYHFPIARRTGKVDENGRDIFLFTDRGYSNTTVRHKSHVSWALHEYRVIECDISSGKVTPEVVEGLKSKLYEVRLKESRARKEWSINNYREQNKQLVADIDTLTRVWGLTYTSIYSI